MNDINSKKSRKTTGVSNPLKCLVMWCKYLFSKPFSFRALICRWRGHPCGVVWYNAGGTEPDMHCKNCGDDLG